MVGKFGKIFDPVKRGLDQIILGLDKKKQEYIEVIGELRKYSKEIVEMVQKTYNIPEINEVNVSIGWVFSPSDHDAKQYKHQQRIKIDIHSDEIYICESDMLHSPDKITCIRYRDKLSVELPKSEYFIQNIKDWSQKAAKLYPGKIKPGQYVSLSVFDRIDPKYSIISNLEISSINKIKDTYSIIYKDKKTGFHSWMTYGLLP
jgi:hypothetical protein